MLHRISKTKNPSFIIGDFNIDKLKMTDTATTFLNAMSSIYFNPNINNPTRLSKEGKFTSLMENIIGKTTNVSFSGTILYDICDHLRIFY